LILSLVWLLLHYLLRLLPRTVNRLKQWLFVRAELVELGLTQIEVLIDLVIPSAYYRVHSRLVATDTYMHCLLLSLVWLLLHKLLRLLPRTVNRLKQRLLVRAELVELGLAQIVVLTDLVVSSAYDRVHSRLVATDTDMHCLLLSLIWLLLHKLLRLLPRTVNRLKQWLFVRAELVELGLAQIVILTDSVVSSAYDRVHSRLVATDTYMHCLLLSLVWLLLHKLLRLLPRTVNRLKQWLFVRAELVELGLAQIVVLTDLVVSSAYDRVHSRLVATDTFMHHLLLVHSLLLRLLLRILLLWILWLLIHSLLRLLV